MPCSVAIIIPVYNVVQYLEQAVQSAAMQEHPQVEVIVVNDGSTPQASEHIAQVCAKFSNVKLIEQENKGAAAARNTGVAHTTADHILFLDADDILQPGAVGILSNALDSNPNAVATYARYQKIEADGTPAGDIKPSKEKQVSGTELLCKLLEVKPPFVIGSICVRRQALLGLQVNNHLLTYGEDWALWCHLALAGNIIPASDAMVVQYRKHDASASMAYIKDPMPVFAAFDMIFKDPAFAKRLGTEQMMQLEQQCVNKTHMQLARYYATQGDTKKAQRHFDAMALPLTSLKKDR